MNGEAAIAGLKAVLKMHHDPHPWDELWNAIAVEHPFRDDWWDDRNILPLLDRVEVPVYLGCDWQNVPLHLPHTFQAINRLKNSPHVQVALMGEHGLAWPWESLHLEALAWFDHWLKGRDTGILEGPRIRYMLPEADEWHTSEVWPPSSVVHEEWELGADGSLVREAMKGSRAMMTLGAGLNRARASDIDPPALLEWNSGILEADLDMIGDIELRLDATSTAPDTAWIATLLDVAPDNTTTIVTAGYLRAGLRELDEVESRPGAPVMPCRNFQPIQVGKTTAYRISLVPNARRFKTGHRIRLVLTSDDQNEETSAALNFRHASIGTSCLSNIHATSRLLLPFQTEP
jgi:predicted acyl esterase